MPTRIIEYEADAVISGDIDVELLRPVDLFSFRVARWMGHAAPKVLCCIAAGLAWSLWFGGVPVSTTALLLAAPSIMLAIFNNIVGQIGVGAFSFWIRDVRGLWFIYQKLVFLLGGMLLPLEILPSGVESLAKAMPFMTMAYVPGRLASGHVEPVFPVWQLGWSVVLVTASAWLFAPRVERIRRQP
ncbi:MAG: ABC-2 family transporter protein [Acidimicrobiia bacterium]|nr:ABC-2 family transporter protein [Acidimicrobiia bacterium]